MSEQTHVEANKKVARDYVQRVFNEHQPDLASDFVTPDVVWHGGILGDVVGAENVTGVLRSFIGPLADLHAVEQDVIAERDLVMLRLEITATQQGDLLGVPASGRQIRWNAVNIYRITDGRISEAERPTTPPTSCTSSVPSSHRGSADRVEVNGPPINCASSISARS